MTETSEASGPLHERVARGDRQALAAFFSRNRERLWHMVKFRLDARLHGRIDPDDVLQESFLAAAQRIEHYDGNSAASLFIWIRMIVLQTMIDLHRRHLGAQMRDADREVAIQGARYPQTTSASLAICLVGDFTTPSQAALRSEMLSTVQQAIEGMDPLDREVLALRHFEELNNNEIAAILGIREKAASMRYVRALRRLKSILADVPGFLDGPQDV